MQMYISITIFFTAVTLQSAHADEEANLIFPKQSHIVEDPTCPCLKNATHLSTPTKFNGSCLDALIKTDIKAFPSSYCYPLLYGNVCGTHDIDLAPFCNDTLNPPEVCGAPWCYVNATECSQYGNQTFGKSNFFPDLWYSYTTCGAKDHWTNFTIQNEIKGVTLRVGVPFLEYPYHYRLDKHGNPIQANPDINAGIGEFKGVYIDFLNGIAEKAKFKVQYESVSSGALAKWEGNAWTACTYDVGRGLLDICLGDFWETSDRMDMSMFSTPIFVEHFYVRVPRPKVDQGLGVEMIKLVEPFTYTLWGTIVLATIGVGLSYAMFNHNRTTSKVGLIEKILGYLYSATMELLQGSDSSEDGDSDSIARRIVTVTWALFIMITVTAYTANLAAFLGQIPPLFEIKSLTDCIAQECQACTIKDAALETQIQQIHPSVILNATFETDLDIINALIDGTCKASIQSAFIASMEPNIAEQCTTMFIGDVVQSFKSAFPVSVSISESLNFWIASAVQNGEFDKALQKYQPPMLCEESDNIFQPSNTIQIGIKSMAGPLIFLGAGIFFALFHSFGKKATKKTEKDILEEGIRPKE